MPKIKKKRIGFKIDMTPMVDVAMLLLTFFMMTTVFRPDEATAIDLPSSHAPFKMPETDVMIVTVNRVGRTYLGVDSQKLRAQLFGEANKLATAVEVDRKQLHDLLIQARISNPKLRTLVKADKDSPFGPVEDILDILRQVKITRFNLVTEMDKS
ncbi:MAG: biopolymer transporter ExbD [Ignavibacteriales bacterium]|nr:biopolymer transporter ExbD [Ignavibacteriales bacterium]